MSARPRATEAFFIVPKASMNAIIERVEGTAASFCISVFVGLRWLANDAATRDSVVEATVAQIAFRSGVSYNTAAKALETLESIGVIAVRRRAIPGTKARALPAFNSADYGYTSITDGFIAFIPKQAVYHFPNPLVPKPGKHSGLIFTLTRYPSKILIPKRGVKWRHKKP